MGNRPVVLFVAVALSGAAVQPVLGQEPTGSWEPPRLSDGRPDLQGVWDFRTATPFERPEGLGERLTEEQAAAIESFAAAAQAGGRPAPAGRQRRRLQRLLARLRDLRRRRPPRVPDRRARERPDARAGRGRRPPRRDRSTWTSRASGPGGCARPASVPTVPEDRGLAERCLVGFNSGPPMMPSAYNNNMQLFQNEDHVVILNEMVHDARIVPLAPRDHLPATVPQLNGDSRGRGGRATPSSSRAATSRTCGPASSRTRWWRWAGARPCGSPSGSPG